MGATIVNSVTIGAGAVVAAGAVVSATCPTAPVSRESVPARIYDAERGS